MLKCMHWGSEARCSSLSVCCCSEEAGHAARLGARVARIYDVAAIQQFAELHGTHLPTLLAVNGLSSTSTPKLQHGQVLQLP